jgi:hypothetical protein
MTQTGQLLYGKGYTIKAGTEVKIMREYEARLVALAFLL